MDIDAYFMEYGTADAYLKSSNSWWSDLKLEYLVYVAAELIDPAKGDGKTINDALGNADKKLVSVGLDLGDISSKIEDLKAFLGTAKDFHKEGKYSSSLSTTAAAFILEVAVGTLLTEASDSLGYADGYMTTADNTLYKYRP